MMLIIDEIDLELNETELKRIDLKVKVKAGSGY
jgi:hypothetical protein